MLVTKASAMWSARTVESIFSSDKRWTRMESGKDGTSLSTGKTRRRTESRVAEEGPIYWSPITTGELGHVVEGERFPSTGLGVESGPMAWLTGSR